MKKKAVKRVDNAMPCHRTAIVLDTTGTTCTRQRYRCIEKEKNERRRTKYRNKVTDGPFDAVASCLLEGLRVREGELVGRLAAGSQ